MNLYNGIPVKLFHCELYLEILVTDFNSSNTIPTSMLMMCSHITKTKYINERSGLDGPRVGSSSPAVLLTCSKRVYTLVNFSWFLKHRDQLYNDHVLT